MKTAGEKNIFGFDKNVFNLGLVSFFTDMSSEMIYPILPIFLSSVLGVSKSFIGLIEGIAEGAGSILRIFSGWLSDMLNKRKGLVVIGYSLSTVTKPFLAIAQSGAAVLCIRIFERAGKALRNPPRDALIAHSAKDTERGRAFGLQRAMDDAGAVAGPLICFLLLYQCRASYRLIFLLSFIPAAVAVAVLVLFIREKVDKAKPQEKIVSHKFSRDFFIFVAITVIFTLGNSSNAFLFLRAQNLGMSVYLLPITWMVFNGTSALSAIPGGMVSDTIGRRTVLILGFFIYGLVYLGFALGKSASLVWLLMAVYGVYYGLTEGAGRAYIADLVEDKRALGTAYGIYHTAVGISLFCASVLFGILWQYFGAPIAFLTGSGLAFLSCILFFIFLKR